MSNWWPTSTTSSTANSAPASTRPSLEDPTLNLRLQWLARSSLPFKEAYDELGRQAPVDRLQSMLDTLPSPERPTMNRRWFLAAAAGLVVSGVVADRLFLGWQLSQQN